MSIGDRIDRARASAGLSQHELAARTGITQPTLSRTIAGTRVPKMNELVAISNATGFLLHELTGSSPISGQVRCAARAANGAAMDSMYQQLLHFLELDAFLDDQGIEPVG